MITAEAAARAAGLSTDTRDTFQETPLTIAGAGIPALPALTGGVLGRPDR
jgi:hypothetical protein